MVKMQTKSAKDKLKLKIQETEKRYNITPTSNQTFPQRIRIIQQKVEEQNKNDQFNTKSYNFL